MFQVLLEAIVVGIMTVIFGNIAGFLVSPFFKTAGDTCKNWNQFYVMEISLFLTGFLIHIFCELSGINKWYCINGAACKKN